MSSAALDLDPYYSELWRRLVEFAKDNRWYDTYSSFYTPKQNLYRFVRGEDYSMLTNRDRLGFHPSSFFELDLLLTAKGY